MNDSNTIYAYPKPVMRLALRFYIVLFLVCLFCWFFVRGSFLFFDWFEYIPFLSENVNALSSNGYEDRSLPYLIMYISSIIIGLSFSIVFLNRRKCKVDIVDSIDVYVNNVFIYWGRKRSWIPFGLSIFSFPLISIFAFFSYGEIDFGSTSYNPLVDNVLYKKFNSFYFYGFLVFMNFFTLTVSGYCLWVLVNRIRCSKD